MRNILIFKHCMNRICLGPMKHVKGIHLPFTISAPTATAIAQGLWELRISEVYGVAPLSISGQTGFVNASLFHRNQVSDKA